MWKSLPALDYNLIILMNINFGMVLVIQSVLCVHSELKLKLLNISSLVVIILSLSAKNQVYILLYGSETNNFKSLNHETLKNVISCLKATTRFHGPSINL